MAVVGALVVGEIVGVNVLGRYVGVRVISAVGAWEGITDGVSVGVCDGE